MRHRIIILTGAAAVILMFAALSNLFMLRFRAGDVYPPYSTLRADPLGAKAIYGSFDACPGISVTRNYVSVDDADIDMDTTLFFLGDSVARDPNKDTLPKDYAARLTKFMKSGGRLVTTLLPRDPPSAWQHDYESESNDTTTVKEEKTEKDQPAKKGEKEKTGPDIDDYFFTSGHMTALTNWLQAAFVVTSNENTDAALLNPRLDGSGFPPSLLCHTTLCFTNVAPEWKVIYQRNGHPVMIERAIGKGSFVFSTLTHFVSNEGLRRERHPALLAWLAGPHKRLAFDESHHGIFEAPGMLSLCRRYRLHWFGIGLIILAAMFVWRNTSGLVPCHRNPATGTTREITRGKDTTSGLANILKRNVPAGAILGISLDEWKKTALPSTPTTRKQIETVERLASLEKAGTLRSDRTIQIYKEMCAALKRKPTNT